MKLLIAIPTLTAFYNYPTYFLLAVVGLLFILRVISEVIKTRPASHYERSKASKQLCCEQVKEVFTALPDKITCINLDFSDWSYRDIQLFAIANGIRGNQKKVKLIQLLQEV
ncbi:MAG: hypothetical protein AAGE84_17140 [Cyanobacteria bacterium P01_G01_bin.39]